MKSIVNDIIHDLKQTKLWLVAALLLAVIVAAPIVLSKGGQPTVASSGPGPVASADSGPQLELTRSTTTGFARAPRVNKHEIDPFGNTPAAYKKVVAGIKKQLEATIEAAVAAGGGSDTTSASGGTDTTVGGVDTGGSANPSPGSGGGGDTNPSTPATTPVKTERDDVIDVVVTPDDDAGAKELDDVRTLSPLPDANNPFLVYVGKTGDDQAQFIVASNAVATGDGTCSPSINDCSTLTLAVGQTEKFTVTTTAAAADPTAGSTTPPVATVEHFSITLVDLQSKKVPVDDGTDATAAAARYETRLRGIGARAVKAALVDPSVLKALIKHHVKIGG